MIEGPYLLVNYMTLPAFRDVVICQQFKFDSDSFVSTTPFSTPPLARGVYRSSPEDSSPIVARTRLVISSIFYQMKVHTVTVVEDFSTLALARYLFRKRKIY